jgi:hypothetical protein
MAAKKAQRGKPLTHSAILERLQSILINAAEGQRSVADDRQYTRLRAQVRTMPFEPPRLVTTHPTIDSFMAAMRGIADRRARVAAIENEFRPLLRLVSDDGAVDSSTWTGQPARTARLKVVGSLLPLAQTAVESMIAELSQPNVNGAPILDERADAITHLRELHRTLGDLLTAVDTGRFDDDFGQGLQAEAARYAKRAARALRNDPMPYLSSALLLGIFSACGLPGIGGYLADVALNVRRQARKSRQI